MKSRSLSWLALAWVATLSSGCYTVMVAPFSSPGLSDDSRLSAAAAKREDRQDESRLGRFESEENTARSRYGAGYGYGYGYPVYGAGYDSQYGGYGIAPYGYGPYYGYGYNPYGGGYGPYGYGYDPYYRSSNGVYIPPGYELVTTGELDALRSAGRGLATTPVQSVTDKEAARKAETKKQQEVWQRRVDPQDRPAPVVTPRPAEAPAGSTIGGSSSSGSSSGSTPKPASSPTTESAGPKKVRR